MEKRKQVYLIIIMLYLLTACGEVTPKSSIPKDDITIPEHIEQTLDSHLIVNANIIPPNSQTLYSYPATVHIFDSTNVNQVLFQQEGIPYDNGADSEMIIQTEEAASIFYSSMLFQNDDYMRYLKVFFGLSDSVDESQKVFSHYESLFVETPQKELASFSIKEAKDAIRDKTEKLGISLAKEPYVWFGIDQKQLADMELLFRQDDLGTDFLEQAGINNYWSEEDECYYILWNIECHGENILSGNYNYVSNVNGITLITNGSTLFACIRKHELVCFEISRTYTIEENGTYEGTIMPIEELLDHINYEYRNLILDSDVTITRIEFCMAPVISNAHTMEYTMTPVWSVLAVNNIANANESIINGTVMLFHAVSGERIN